MPLSVVKPLILIPPKSEESFKYTTTVTGTIYRNITTAVVKLNGVPVSSGSTSTTSHNDGISDGAFSIAIKHNGSLNLTADASSMGFGKITKPITTTDTSVMTNFSL